MLRWIRVLRVWDATRWATLLASAALIAVPGACSRSHASAQSETAPPLASGKAGAPGPSAESGSGKPFGAPCVGDAECAGGACFHKHVHDMHGAAEAGHEHKSDNDAVQADGYCSIRCTDDTDCPVPPTAGKCGGRGLCKQ